MYLGYQAPFRFGELLAFFRERALTGVELVGEESYARAVRFEGPSDEATGWVRVEATGWVCVEDDAARNRLAVISLWNSLEHEKTADSKRREEAL